MNTAVRAVAGEIFAIPLFVSDLHVLTPFAPDAFRDAEGSFAYCRVIEDRLDEGLLIEIFEITGGLDIDLREVIASERLFRPMITAGLGIMCNRWLSLGIQTNFDPELDSEYSQNQLLIGPETAPRIWQGGKETPVDPHLSVDVDDWRVYFADDVERRINRELVAA